MHFFCLLLSEELLWLTLLTTMTTTGLPRPGRAAEELVLLLAQQVVITLPSAKREFPGAPAAADNALQCSTFGRDRYHRHSPSSEIARWFAAAGQTWRYRSLVQRPTPGTHLRRSSSPYPGRFSPSVRTRSALAGMVASSTEAASHHRAAASLSHLQIQNVSRVAPLRVTGAEFRRKVEL